MCRAKLSLANKDIGAAAEHIKATGEVEQSWGLLLEHYPAFNVAAGASDATELEGRLVALAQALGGTDSNSQVDIGQEVQF